MAESTIAAITEVGYHRCSLGEISKRSGVSRGGIFRHFETRLDLIVTAAQELSFKQLALGTAYFEGSEIDIDTIVRYARDRQRHSMSIVWFELLIAARTDADLRERLAPVAVELLVATEEASRPLAEHLGMTTEHLHLVLTSTLHMFDGEGVFRATYPRTDLEEQRVELATRLFSRSKESLA